MAKPADDYEALRIVVETLKDFDPKDQQRIFRWAAEKLELPDSPAAGSSPQQHAASPTPSFSQAPGVQGTPQDIKSFVATKNPNKDVQLVAVIAYYYEFVAPQAERKTSINAQDLKDACRKAGRPQFKHAGQTLRNAHKLGLLDKATESGSFSINAVGENLVTMTLPSGQSISSKRKRMTKKSQSSRKPAKKSNKA